MTSTEPTVLHDRLYDAVAAMKCAAHSAERVAERVDAHGHIEPAVVFDQLEQFSLYAVRLLAATRQDDLPCTGDLSSLERRHRVTYELFTTASSAARQFHHTLAEIADEHHTLP